MKTHLRLLLIILSVSFLHVSYAQVSLVSNNNYLSGYVLPNGVALLENDSSKQLYTTNGTTATLLTTSVTSSDTGSAAIYKNQLYFTGKDASNDGELWATDGTAAGTRLIKNISASGSSFPDNFFIFNNTLYFTADDGVHGRRLWASDGTGGNTNIVSTTVSAKEDLINLILFFQNNNAVFFEGTDNSNNFGLYKLTSSGISLVKEFSGGSISPTAALGNKTLFTVDTTTKIFDSIFADTLIVPDTTNPAINDTTIFKDSVFSYSSYTDLWVTDGSTNGTQLLHHFVDGSPYTFIPFKGLLYFGTPDPTHEAIWTTDGTAANTVVFKNFDADTSGTYIASVFENAAVFNNKLYFTGYSNSTGYELWSSDGTVANTALLKDINVGKGSSSPTFLADLGSFAKMVSQGTGSVNFDFQQYIIPFKGKIYFTANDSLHGTELWNTDGTAANTALVKDINSDTTASGVGGDIFLEAYYTTNGIYFVANDGTTGNEPWVTDGTTSGTNLVADINPGSNNSNPEYSFIYNNQLYFDADNGDNTPSSSSYGRPDLYKINQSTSSLPVSLLSFAATLQTSSVLLNWVTTNEINTQHFTVERSVDGIHFSEIGTLAALGSSTSKHNYQLNDASALQTGTTVLYYRLKTTDKNGVVNYTGILTVRLHNGMFTFKLSPNPVHNQLTVAFSTGNATRATLLVTDANGRQLFQQEYATSQAAVQQNINVGKFAPGTYFIQLLTDKETKSLKFIKQ